MSDPVDDGGSGPDPSGEDPAGDDPLGEVKEAAGAVLVSLRWLIDAAERALDEDGAVDAVVDAGRGIAQAFTEGFTSDPADRG